jgi:hypothetical protein
MYKQNHLSTNVRSRLPLSYGLQTDHRRLVALDLPFSDLVAMLTFLIPNG